MDEVARSKDVWSRKGAERCYTDGRRPVKRVAMDSRWRRDHAEDGECMTHRQSPVPANTNALSLFFIFPHVLELKHAEKDA